MQVENIQVDSNIVPDLDNIGKGQLNLFELAYNPDVLDCLSSLSNDEVFTSPKLANQMLDLLPADIWQNPQATFLDPVCKAGVFLREIVKRLDKGLAKQIPDRQIRINHILTKQVFGIAITHLTALLSRRSVYCAKEANSRLSICTGFDDDMGNIIFGQVEHIFQDGKCTQCGASEAVFGERKGLENHAYAFIHTNKSNQYKELETMKFDVIIGNPPYQLKDEKDEKRASASPIYHYFVEQAKKLNPNYLIMITPSRWFTGGKGLNNFRDGMINDNRIKQIHDYLNEKDCFPNQEIKGGVSYFLWDREYNGECEIFTYENDKCISHSKRPLKEKGLDVFIRYNQAVAILNKVKKHNEPSFNEIISSAKPFGLRTYFKGNSKPYKNKNDNVTLYQNGGIGYVSREKIPNNRDWILRHKVIVPYAVGSGDGKTDKVNPIYAGINTACTETYLVIGPFENEDICNNVMSYINTKFLHFMLTLKKNTQHATRGAYQFVPMQDFTQSWTDEKLYQKYGLSKDEIAFIESMIRPMDNDSDKPKKSRTKKAKQADLLESGDE